MTSGSLFHGFSAKDETLVAVMEEGIRYVFARVRSGLEAEARMPEKLLVMVRCHLGALLGASQCTDGACLRVAQPVRAGYGACARLA